MKAKGLSNKGSPLQSKMQIYVYKLKKSSLH